MANSVMDATAKPDVPVHRAADWTLERIASERKAGSLREQRRNERARFERFATRVSALLSSHPSIASGQRPHAIGSVSSRLNSSTGNATARAGLALEAGAVEDRDPPALLPRRPAPRSDR
jgi:hypothetical protein